MFDSDVATREGDLNDLQPFAGKNTSIQVEFVKVEDRVSLRVINFVPKEPKWPIKLLFVPGWISLLNSWRYFLPIVTEQVHLIYVETREKSTAKINGETTFSVHDIANDIRQIIKFCELETGNYVLAGSSLGATAILESVSTLETPPSGMVLILPNAEFQLPKYTPLILKVVPSFLLPALRPIVKWGMLKFKINPNDNEHKQRFITSLNAANTVRLRSSALAVYDYRMDFEMLKQIQVPSLIIGAIKDGEHNQEDVKKIAMTLPVSEYTDLTTFTATHSTKAARLLLAYLEQLNSIER